jgi:hypothetical protein
MTNAAIAMELEATPTGTNAVWEVISHPPVFTFGTIWAVSLLIIPIASVVIFVHCWKSRRRIGGATWHVHALLLAALVMATTTACSFFSALNNAFSYSGMWGSGAAFKALLFINIAHDCTFAIIGILATAFSLALAIVASMIKKSNDRKP